MNERIQKLAKKAGATINQGFDGKKDFITSIYMSPEEFEKFAELIVRECADIAGAGLNFRELGLSGSSSFDVGRMIKQHFGVEE